MSNRAEREAEDRYEAENDFSAPVDATPKDNSYVGETNSDLKGTVPVQKDDADFDDPMQPPYSNSDEQLRMCRPLMKSPLIINANYVLGI